MTPRRLFVLNAVIAGFYGIALLAVTDPILDIYGIDANADGVYMARWFGLGLIATGLTTWLTRDAADSPAGRGIGRPVAHPHPHGTIRTRPEAPPLDAGPPWLRCNLMLLQASCREA